MRVCMTQRSSNVSALSRKKIVLFALLWQACPGDDTHCDSETVLLQLDSNLASRRSEMTEAKATELKGLGADSRRTTSLGESDVLIDLKKRNARADQEGHSVINLRKSYLAKERALLREQRVELDKEITAIETE